MNCKRSLVFNKATLLLCCVLFINAAHAQKLRRSESFAGLHVDFHAFAEDSGIGKTFTYEMIDSLLRITKPDFIQVDCKGHPGISSYPTKVGNAAPAFDKDILRIWREVTNKYHVALYVHYSGILDAAAVAKQPVWARVNSDGSYDKEAASLFGPYSDSLLIPQLKELALDYNIDGAWIDGDCWALAPDYSSTASAAFTKATSVTSVPKDITDKNYFQLAEFNRRKFHDYVSHYVNAVHGVRNNFQITSNWSFSSFIPEPVDVPVDFLSGDVAGKNSLYSAAFESRCMALQGKPWDLMSWSFGTSKGFSLTATKPFVQLAQEAAEVMAMGGGYQTYWQQNADGSIKPHLIHQMAEVIKFCRERQPYCFKGSIVPQIGLLYSTYAWRRIPSQGLYNGSHLEGLKGTLAALLDSQLPVEVLMDHQLKDRLKNYPLIIFPEWQTIDPDQKTMLLNYVAAGGNLLVTGANAANIFKEDLGLKFIGEIQQDADIVIGVNKNTQIIQTNFQPSTAASATQKIGAVLLQNDLRFPASTPLATVQNFGKGKVAIIYADLAKTYTNQQSPVIKNLLQETIQQLFTAPMVTVKGSNLVHQVISKKEGHLFIHLINSGGQHNNPNVLVYDELPKTGPLTISVRLPKKPAKITLQPGQKNMAFTYQNNLATVVLPALEIYSILEID